MFSRYPRSILRHELSHSTRVATFKAGGLPRPGNDAGLGPPGGAAHQELSGASGEVMAAARSSRSRTPRGRAPKYASVTEFRAKYGEGVVERAQGTVQAHPNPFLSVTSSDGWEFPPARPGAPGRRSYRRGSLKCVRSLRGRSDEVRKAKAEYEEDKYAKSAVESVRSRLWWWRQRADEHEVEPFPLTVDKLQLLGALLKASGYRSAVAYLGAAKKEHIKLGFPWTGALDLELRDGTRACERGIGPPRKCGAFNLQKLAEVPTTQGALCKGGPRWPREGTLCGCWWAMREMELSTIRCSQVSFKAGPGCGSCTFDLPVSKTDTQALGKRRTHTCTCSAAGGRSLCPVKTARDLHAAARSFAPAGANPDPGMRPLWPTRRGQFPSKKSVTLTFQKLAGLSGVDVRITGHVCRVTGAQAMAVAGIELWLIQAFCRWGSRAVLEYVRDCQLASATDLAVRVAKGVQLTEVRDSIYERLNYRVEPGMAVATERAFEEALEESVQGCSIGGLMADQVREQVQGRLQVAGVGPARFVSCAETNSGRLHIGKTDVVTWCGRRWVHRVSEGLPELTRCRQCLRAVALGVSGGEVQVLDP